jgi:mannan polymerase II complex HOC1 subunit
MKFATMGVATQKNWQRLLRIGVVVTCIILLSSYFLHQSGRLGVNRSGSSSWESPLSSSHDSVSTGQHSNSDSHSDSNSNTKTPPTTIITDPQFNDEESHNLTQSHPYPDHTPEKSPMGSSPSSSLPGKVSASTPWDGRLEPTLPDTVPGIPGKVWQSAKNNTFTNDQLKIINSWIEKNPYFRYELLTDESAENYVNARYNESRPDIVSLYRALPLAILRADFLRYLILLADGGIWSDIDVTCEIDVAHWLPAEYYEEGAPEVGLIVGLEFDIGWRGEGSTIASQLTNWIFAARPGSRHLLHVVNSIVKTLNGIAVEYGVTPAEITFDMISDVVDVTGPKKMTIGILESLSQMLGRTVDDRDIAERKSPKLVGDVMIMPGMAFAAQQNGFPEDQGKAMVTHHYAGSWKEPADAARERRKKLEEEKKKLEEAARAKAKAIEEEEKKQQEAAQASGRRNRRHS